MPEKPQEKKSPEKESEKSDFEKPEADNESAWSKDQKKRSYYYDDACGYEIYKPEEDAENDE